MSKAVHKLRGHDSTESTTTHTSRFKKLLSISATVLGIVAAGLWTVSAGAEDPSPSITHIEEDWKIELGVPDPGNEAPQIIVVGAPTGTLNDVHAVFEINHQTLPDYESGGMQLQRWLGENPLHYHNFPANGLLAFDSESVRFTMSMKVDGGLLRFDILNGTSSTWGEFGGQGYLRCWASTSLTDLGSYNPETSLQQSRVGFASHRVKQLTRTAVRYYAGENLVATDSEEKIVHQYTEGY
jgi:hypothetical protein